MEWLYDTMTELGDLYMSHIWLLCGVTFIGAGLSGIVTTSRVTPTRLGFVGFLGGGAVITALGLLGILGFVTPAASSPFVMLILGVNMIGQGTGWFFLGPENKPAKFWPSTVLGAFSTLTSLVVLLSSIWRAKYF